MSETRAAPQKLGEEHYRFLSLEEAASPSGGTYFQRYENYWWVVHPEKGLTFWNPVSPRTGRRRRPGLGSAQGNTDERITRLVARHVGWEHEIRLVPLAWVPVSPTDFA